MATEFADAVHPAGCTRMVLHEFRVHQSDCSVFDMHPITRTFFQGQVMLAAGLSGAVRTCADYGHHREILGFRASDQVRARGRCTNSVCIILNDRFMNVRPIARTYFEYKSCWWSPARPGADRAGWRARITGGYGGVLVF